MDCPVCGCKVELEREGQQLVECACCGAVWLVCGRTLRLDRVLVGAEG